MSHFVAMVIGKNLEQQLAPYHEFECTGHDDQHVKDVDVTAEVQQKLDDGKDLEDALDWHGLSEKVIASEEEIDTSERHKYGHALVQNGKLIKAIRRTNPQAKWDWWVVGGRWAGFFKLKADGVALDADECSPGFANAALKKHIDFEGMRADAAQAAGEEYDKVIQARRGMGLADDIKWESWEAIRAAHPDTNIEVIRKDYHAQAGVVATKKAFPDAFFMDPDVFLVSRDEYIASAKANATTTFSVVKDGLWNSRGEMGWFGMSTDTTEGKDWNAEVNAILDALPDDTEISIVDCHI